MKKYFIEFLVIFIGITASFLVDEWREDRQNRAETLKALKLIKFDLRIDTNYYKLRLNRLARNAERLKPGLSDQTDTLTTRDINAILKGLRSNADYQVQNHGYNYLNNNIQFPTLKNDSILTDLGMYNALSSGDGNYRLFSIAHFEMSLENYKNMANIFPKYLNEDTVVVNRSIEKNKDRFLSDPYWKGRIGLMYKEATQYMPEVYNKNLKFAEHILAEIEKELNQ